MDKRFGLPSDDIDSLRGVFKRYPEIQQVVIYGARAKGNYRAGSDIDLTILSEMDWHAFNRLSTDLDDLLLPYQIDLSLYGYIDNSELKGHIELVGLVFYSRSGVERCQ